MLTGFTKYGLPAVAALLLLPGCAREERTGSVRPPAPVREPAASYARGILRIRSGHELAAEEIEALAPRYTVTRTFPPAGRFERRHREAGLHLWYDILFDPEEPLTRAGEQLSGLLDIEETERVPVPRADAVEWPFNDPEAGQHWDYWNEGTGANTRAGSDIRLLPAWGVTTGRPEVIVAVSDSGVETTHEDLARNLWVNPAEKDGVPGVDDDGNGYVDDIYGFNFCYVESTSTLKGALEPGDHGTHVAGTIAAVNDNGLGGCGIAGGNGSPDSGVRIMSTQILSGKSNTAASLVYAADMGALLVNCSWSYGEAESTPSSVKTAINYFNTHAGTDENGRQTGLMKGGLAIFAAGNNQTESGRPAMEESVFAVAAVGADYVRSYYSNYGEWVDISAPGGDSKKGSRIYSTITGNAYGGKQGTSMATPHVTGVAALVISRFGGPGFSREKLIRILENSADRVIYNYNPDLTGKLGAGLVDAFAALSNGTDPVPSPVTDLSGTVEGNALTLNWKMPDNGFQFTVYYGKESLARLDPDALPEGVSVRTLLNPGKQPGETLSLRFDGLDFRTPYHFRIGTESVSGKKAELSGELVLTTESNRPPVVTPLDGTSLTLTANGSGKLRFEIGDPDGHALTYAVPAPLQGITASRQENIVTIEIRATELEDGKVHEGELAVSDPFDTTVFPFQCTVLKNNPPALTGEIGDMILPYGTGTRTVDLRDIFSDPDKDALEYRIQFGAERPPFHVEIAGNILNIRPDSYGSTPVGITASDYRGASATTTFNILVRDTSKPVDLFPNPVRSQLTIRPGAPVRTGVRIVNATGMTVFSVEAAEAGPFAPLFLDLGHLPAGRYSAILDGDGVRGSYAFVKL